MLDFGGDDITEFLHGMLKEIDFPYPSADMSRLSDLNVMDDLKARVSTLLEVCLALPHLVLCFDSLEIG